MGVAENQAAHLVSREECLLVMIDVQEKLCRVMSEAGQILDNCKKLCSFAGIMKLPLVVTEQEKLGDTVTPLLEVMPSGQPRVGKVSFDCFGEPAFGEAVRSHRRDTLIIFGIESHICVAQTALSALKGGYRVQVMADAVSSRDPQNKVIALERLNRAGAVVTSTEMVMYELLKRAGTDEFRAVLPLVK